MTTETYMDKQWSYYNEKFLLRKRNASLQSVGFKRSVSDSLTPCTEFRDNKSHHHQ